MKPTFFPTPEAFRKWLERHCEAHTELLVGFYKTGSGKPSITWPQSVDEALCFGWIDGVRKRIDDESYTIRFSPRKPTSIWSLINIKKVAGLTEQGKMTPRGQRAFEARRENKSGVYSFEKRPAALTEPYAAMLAKSVTAQKFFDQQPASYRRAAIWWVISAKKEETRLKRAKALIDVSKQRKGLAHLTRWRP
jgi:uncharacterized protein YdeI (YjbR/CyaY-like superfamily)